MTHIYVCDTCGTEITGDYCEEHPNATIHSLRLGNRPYNKLNVKLKAGDAERIDRYLRTHVLSRRIWTRLLILKLLDKGFPASQVAEIAEVSPTTVRAIARRYMQAGLDDILNPIR